MFRHMMASLLLLGLLGGPLFAAPPANLIHQYPFDTNADDAVGTDDGTLTNGATIVTDGTRGGVVELDGTDDYVDLPTSNLTAGRSEVTLAFWVKLDDNTSTDTLWDEHYNWYWQCSIRNGAWYTRDSSTGTTGSRNNDLSLPTISTGTWHHLAFVYSVSDGSKKIYLDGELEATSTTSVDTLTSDRASSRLGFPSDGTYCDGRIDDFQVYSRALTAGEIAYLAEQNIEMVNWGDSAGNNVFSFSDWDNVYLGNYTSYSASGPDGIDGGWTGQYDTCGINGSSESFSEGEQIVVTWYNEGGSSITFTPKISFDDPDYYNGGTSGTWYDMTQATVNAGQTATTSYTFTSQTAGTYSRVHVCRVLNGGNDLICDKIDYQGAGGGTSPTYYTLTVNNGTGDGSYEEDDVVNITADSPATGYSFAAWTGDTSYVVNVNNASTTVTMPASNVTVTATYTQNQYSLTVNNGSGDGSYTPSTQVNIAADSPATGYVFDDWEGDTTYVDDVDDPTTFVTMPASNVTVTATYTYVGTDPAISSTSGTWADGNSITISGANFGTKSTAAPKLWDTVDNQTSYASLDEGDVVPVTASDPWSQNVNIYADDTVRYTEQGNRGVRSAHYTGTGNKAFLGWPRALGGTNPPSSQDELYVTWWYKPSQGPDSEGGSNKFIRIWDDSNGYGTRVSWTQDQLTYPGTTPAGYNSWDENGNVDEWNRMEIWVSTDDGTIRTYENTLESTWSNSSVGGEFDVEFVKVDNGIGLNVALVGFDHGMSAYDNMVTEFGEVYIDTTRARVEIGDAATWAASTHREIQIPSAWSTTSVTITVNKGSFSSLSGKYLYIVDADGNVSAGYQIP